MDITYWIENASNLAFKNKTRIQQSSWAGCYYCHALLNPRNITSYCDAGQTALCPCCGIDSVIPLSTEGQLTTENLKEIGDVLFAQVSPIDVDFEEEGSPNVG